jgi:hypothetical protein
MAGILSVFASSSVRSLASLAAGARAYQGAVDIDPCLVENGGRLLTPDFDPRLIEDILKGLDILDGDASAEVSGSGGVGNAVGTERVEEDDFVASQFDIVEARASTEGVVGEVENVITLVIRQVILQPMESFVDGLGESEFPNQEWDGTDAAGCDGSGSGGDRVVDIRGGEDGPRRGRMDGPIEPVAEFSLAGGVVLVCGIGFTRNLLVDSVMGSE